MSCNFIRGGVFRDKRTYIMSGVGIMSAIAAYLVGDTDIFALCQALFTICGIYFVRKSDNKTKGK
jgi:hypothetical protein